jgi:hypothetical protein
MPATTTPTPLKPQDYASHRRLNPLHHFVATPLVLAYLVFTVVELVRGPSVAAVLHVVFALGVLALAVSTRLMALTVQDRVIRLEMRLRLREVLPAPLAGRLHELSGRHLVALRFASDEELPGLVERVLDGDLASGDAIKREIRDWQPDHLRA